jgi:23S rRNA (uracil1939-C5)-methyltransferase
LPVSETIVRIAARGEGVSPSGRHYALTAPGDVVADDGSIEAGPHRIAAACRHFPACGGCQLQHIDDSAYATFLSDRISGALLAQRLAVPDIRTPYLSAPQTRRRASLTVERLGKAVRIGFNEAGSHRIVDLAECPVLHPALLSLVKPLRSLLTELVADRRRATLRLTLADQGIDVLVEGISIEGLAETEAVSGFAADHRLARLSIDEGFGPSVRWEPEPVTISLGGRAVPLPEGAFLQATADGEEMLVAVVKSGLEGDGPVADLFAGLGTFALQLSRPVHAVEGSRDAVLALQTAAKREPLPISIEHRDLFRRPLSATELGRFSSVILDPPRAGAKEQVAEIGASSVQRVLYVSCNPSTFARDARTLVDGGYGIDWIQPVGQFRWSTHVELVAQLSR